MCSCCIASKHHLFSHNITLDANLVSTLVLDCTVYIHACTIVFIASVNCIVCLSGHKIGGYIMYTYTFLPYVLVDSHMWSRHYVAEGVRLYCQ